MIGVGAWCRHALVEMGDDGWAVNQNPLPPFVATIKQVVEFLRHRQPWWPCPLKEGLAYVA